MKRRPPKWLDQLREAIRVRHYSICTENVYCDWARRVILFHGKRHPRDMAADAGRLGGQRSTDAVSPRPASGERTQDCDTSSPSDQHGGLLASCHNACLPSRRPSRYTPANP